jgi:hypothetical protein
MLERARRAKNHCRRYENDSAGEWVLGDDDWDLEQKNN